MLQKGCECREREMEKWKQNWDEVFMDEVRREERVSKREREEKKGKMRGKSEREKVKCHKMFTDRKGRKV
jgi:hypothetical protein